MLDRRTLLPWCARLQSVRVHWLQISAGPNTGIARALNQLMESMQVMPCVQSMSVHDETERTELRWRGVGNIGELTRLTSLSLDVLLAKRVLCGVLQQHGRLPLLQQLALPADLLCGVCHPGAPEQLQLLLSPPCAQQPSGGSSNDTMASTAQFGALKQLVFMHGHWPHIGRSGGRCRHHDTAAFAR